MIAVYMLLDSMEIPVYIGASRDVDKRVLQHRAKPWWPEVASVEIYAQSDWNLALYVERKLIRRFSPQFNRQSVDPVDWVMNLVTRPMYREMNA